MANSSNILMLLLAIVALAMTARVIGLEQEEKLFRFASGDPKIRFALGDPKFADCWKSISAVEGCADSVISSFFNWRIGLTPECCKAIDGLGNNCLDMFSVGPFYNSQFLPFLKAFCDGKTSPAPTV